MSRNRKNRPPAVRFGPAIKSFVCCLLIGGAGVGYVAQKNQLYMLAEQYRDLELRLEKLRRENAGRARLLDLLQTPSELELRVKQMNLGLQPPHPSQIIRIVELASQTDAEEEPIDAKPKPELAQLLERGRRALDWRGD